MIQCHACAAPLNPDLDDNGEGMFREDKHGKRQQRFVCSNCGRASYRQVAS